MNRLTCLRKSKALHQTRHRHRMSRMLTHGQAMQVVQRAMHSAVDTASDLRRIYVEHRQVLGAVRANQKPVEGLLHAIVFCMHGYIFA